MTDLPHARPGSLRLLLLLLACLLLPAAGVVHAEDEKGEDAKPMEAAPAEEVPAEGEAAEAKELVRRPLLWLIEGSPRMFLYGTIHVNDERVTKHLPVVQQAIDQSTAVYTELAMDPAGMMAMGQATIGRSRLPAGETLKGILGADLHERLAKALGGTVAPILETGKPWLAMMFLIQKSLAAHQQQRAEEAKKAGKEPLDPNAPALDPMIFNAASQAGKQVGGLETIDVQLDAFDNLSTEAQVDMLRKSVESDEKSRAGDSGEVDEGIAMLGDMVDMWLAGDDAGFAKLFEDDLRKDGEAGEAFVEALLDNRNVGMVKGILEHRQADPTKTYFFAVGAGHMPGDKGVVKLLESSGLIVRRMELGEKLPPLPAAAKEAPAAPKADQPAPGPGSKKREPVGAGG